MPLGAKGILFICGSKRVLDLARLTKIAAHRGGFFSAGIDRGSRSGADDH